MLQAKKQGKAATYRADREMPKLKCPACNARLLDAGSVAVKRETRLFVFTGAESAQFVIKCRACGVCVGITASK